MKSIAELLLLVSLPFSAIMLNGQPFVISALIISSLGVCLVVMLSVSHHDERGKLQPAKFTEYLMLTLVIVVSYLFLV